QGEPPKRERRRGRGKRKGKKKGKVGATLSVPRPMRGCDPLRTLRTGKRRADATRGRGRGCARPDEPEEEEEEEESSEQFRERRRGLVTVVVVIVVVTVERVVCDEVDGAIEGQERVKRVSRRVGTGLSRRWRLAERRCEGATAGGPEMLERAVSGEVDGRDGPAIWLCTRGSGCRSERQEWNGSDCRGRVATVDRVVCGRGGTSR
ncbi:hypothetical protein BJ546DRAFT_976550, partial [Cryomyces antarcticus]